MTRGLKRTIWVVRHGERLDNIQPDWKQTAKRWDDPPLRQTIVNTAWFTKHGMVHKFSTRGHQQALEVGSHLEDQVIDHVFCSPFTRCVQTATNILHYQTEKPPMLNIEPGLSESLNACNDPPGRPTLDQIIEMTKSVNISYKPVYDSLPAEVGGDYGCAGRIANTVKELLQRHPTGNILLVSHGSPIAAVHEALFGQWNYVGQCTIGRINDENGNYSCEFYGSKNHLTDKTNLHDVQSQAKLKEPRQHHLKTSQQIMNNGNTSE